MAIVHQAKESTIKKSNQIRKWKSHVKKSKSVTKLNSNSGNLHPVQKSNGKRRFGKELKNMSWALRPKGYGQPFYGMYGLLCLDSWLMVFFD
ncbi:hypothetical protein ACE6H2_018272 [Prunus campanulata]